MPPKSNLKPKPSSTPRHVTWPMACRLLRDGDIGLLRPTTREGRWIYRLGWTNFSHACMFGQLARVSRDPEWWIFEQIQPEGRAVPAGPYVLGCPSGTFTVFRSKKSTGYSGTGAIDWMQQNVPGTPYPRWLLIRSLLSHLAFTRWKVRPDSNDGGNGQLKSLYCSAAVARACRVGGGVDLVPRLSDVWTEPGHLALSAGLDELFTIVHGGKSSKPKRRRKGGVR